MPAHSNESILEVLRSQALDENGKPRSSYWGAKLKAEENRFHVSRLEEELGAFRNQNGSTPSSKRDDTLVADLRSQLHTLEEKKKSSQVNFQRRIHELNLSIVDLKGDLKDTSTNRDRWKAKFDLYEKLVLDLREELRNVYKQVPPGQVMPLRHYPSTQDILEWMGVTLVDGRVLAAGYGVGYQIEIKLEGNEIVRKVILDSGYERKNTPLKISEPAHNLVTIFLPYQKYYEYQSDPGVLEVLQLLGRPLTLE